MQTLHLTEHDAARAGDILRHGGLVAFPTETVYGLGANAFDADAVRRIFEAKGRPCDNPLIAHVCDLDTLPTLWREIPDTARTLAAAFWPGPLTMILPRTAAVPDALTAGLDTVAVRFPSHPVAQAVIRAAGVPIAAPSANLSGHPSPTTYEHVLHDLGGRVDAIVEGGMSSVGLESTVVAVEEHRVTVLRPGGISPEMLAVVLDDAEVIIDPGVTCPVESAPRSPGMKYRHYAPLAPMTAFTGDPDRTAAAIREKIGMRTDCAALLFDEYDAPCSVVHYGGRADSLAQAHRLFDALRKLDDLAPTEIFAQCPDETGVGLAVANRIKRAAGFHVVNIP